MPVQIGDKAHSFSNPTGLLSDCHRRIEMFLRVLDRIAQIIDQPLASDDRSSLETALSYFRDSAPKHTADEEVSLFPRLNQLSHPDLDSMIQKLTHLEDDHRIAEELHSQVEHLGQRGLKHGYLSQPDAELFRNNIATLTSIYAEHIGLEDNLVFPLAAKILSETDKAAIAAEMAARREIPRGI